MCVGGTSHGIGFRQSAMELRHVFSNYTTALSGSLVVSSVQVGVPSRLWQTHEQVGDVFTVLFQGAGTVHVTVFVTFLASTETVGGASSHLALPTASLWSAAKSAGPIFLVLIFYFSGLLTTMFLVSFSTAQVAFFLFID